ncbi:GNAT family N-acetyltransferase [Cupriavidus sp. CP313]
MRPHFATSEDLPEVEALLRSCALHVEGVGEHIEQYLVTRDNSGLLGCVGVEHYGTIGLLRGLAVAEHARSAGLGELLLSAIVADARQRGVESMVVRTASAAAYFSRFGFAPIGTSEVRPDVFCSQEFSPANSTGGTVMQIAL